MTQRRPKIVAAIALTAVLAAGAYLYAVRGTAMLLDLSTMVQGLLCL